MVRSASVARMAKEEKRARETSVVNISVVFVQGAKGCLELLTCEDVRRREGTMEEGGSRGRGWGKNEFEGQETGTEPKLITSS